MNFIYKYLKEGLLLLAIMSIFLSCERTNDNTHCRKVRYISEYCAEDKPLHLIEFLEENSYATPISSGNFTHYMAAIADLPQNIQKTDTIFSLYFHYDKKFIKNRRPQPCPAMFSPVNILVCDRVSSDPCEIQIGN